RRSRGLPSRQATGRPAATHPAYPPLVTGASTRAEVTPSEVVERDRGGAGHTEGVDARPHGDPRPHITRRERAVAEARAFGSEHDRDAVCPDLVERVLSARRQSDK